MEHGRSAGPLTRLRAMNHARRWMTNSRIRCTPVAIRVAELTTTTWMNCSKHGRQHSRHSMLALYLRCTLITRLMHTRCDARHCSLNLKNGKTYKCLWKHPTQTQIQTGSKKWKKESNAKSWIDKCVLTPSAARIGWMSSKEPNGNCWANIEIECEKFKERERCQSPINANGSRDSTQKSISPTPSIRMGPTPFHIAAQKWGKCECQWCNETLLHRHLTGERWAHQIHNIIIMWTPPSPHRPTQCTWMLNTLDTIPLFGVCSKLCARRAVGSISLTEEKGRRVPFPFPFDDAERPLLVHTDYIGRPSSQQFIYLFYRPTKLC